jgi:hypothetical protein
VAIVQAFLALIGRSAGKILNAIFGWAVRALFGQTTARERTFLSVVVGAAVAWPILLIGIVAPKTAVLLLAFVPLPHWIPSWTVRLVWTGLALVIPIGVGVAVAAKAPPGSRTESILTRVLRGFPITVGLAGAFLIMFVSVPIMRLAAIVRRYKSADIPLVTDAAAYHDVAHKICEVLNRHGFSFRSATPGWWVAAPTRILGALGGDAFRAYVPDELEHFASGALEMSLYPSGLLLRGPSTQLTWAHGLVAETVVHTAGLQTSDVKAQELERRLRDVWASHDGGRGAQVPSCDLELMLDRITRDLGALDVVFDDWQVVYRQILQVGRAVRGERQLLDAQAPVAGGDADFMGKTEPSLSYPTQFGASELTRQIVHSPEMFRSKQVAPTNANREDALDDAAVVASKARTAPLAANGGGVRIRRAMVFLGAAPFVGSGVLALSRVVPAWEVGLLVSDVLLVATAVLMLIGWKRRQAAQLIRADQPRAG